MGLGLDGLSGTLGVVGNSIKYFAGDQRSLAQLAVHGGLKALPISEGLRGELANAAVNTASDKATELILKDACE